MKRALISVSDKSNIVQFVQELVSLDYEIVATGGTRKILQDANIPIIPVQDITGVPEILDGRVKTLHPNIHGALLALHDKPSHHQDMMQNEISYIDLICVNLYPFEQTISRENVCFKDAIEQIDIGGPAMLRSASKNYEFVTVVTDILDYNSVINEIKLHGDTLPETKKLLGAKAFRTTAAYDATIAEYLTNNKLKSMQHTITMSFNQELRYGENPHQEAALFSTTNTPYSLLQATILNGKPLSFNNIQDANAAINILAEHTLPTAVTVKHMNPCGVGSSSSIEQAFDYAYTSDSVSIFGGIVALNHPVTLPLAKKMNDIFLEIIIAPKYNEDALNLLKRKKNLRLLELDTSSFNTDSYQYVSVNGGILVQEIDQYMVQKEDVFTVTAKKPSEERIDELLFAWKVAKHVKSNAIVITSGMRTVGIGAGQMNRVGAAKIALEWAREHGHKEHLILASDAFFPFNDVVKLANEYGVTDIIQPGGSIRDQESIDACNDRNMTMVFTKTRHFKH